MGSASAATKLIVILIGVALGVAIATWLFPGYGRAGPPIILVVVIAVYVITSEVSSAVSKRRGHEDRQAPSDR